MGKHEEEEKAVPFGVSIEDALGLEPERRCRRPLVVAGALVAAVGLVVAGAAVVGSQQSENEARLALFLAEGELCLDVSRMVTETGSIGEGQSLTGLLEQTLSGSDDTWEDYVEFEISSTKEHVTDLYFEVPEYIPSDLVQGAAIAVNYMGESGQLQLWEAQVRNSRQLRWETMWDNTQDVSPWVWSASKRDFTLTPGSWGEFMDEANQVNIRLISRAGVTLNSLFDYFSLCITIPSEVPVPVPTSDPEPTEPIRKSCYFLNEEMQAVSGSLGPGQSVATLANKELSGSQDVWLNYVEFIPPAGSSTASVFTFELLVLPETVPPFLERISAVVNMRGPEASYQEWYIRVLNRATGAYEAVLDNTEMPSWTWFEKTQYMNATEPTNYISASYKMEFQIYSPTNNDAFQLDALQLCLENVNDDLPTPPTVQPTTAAPTTAAPTTAAPTTAAPTTAAPTTAAPTTAAPTTAAPTTAAPTTAAPTTAAPTTAAPTTAEPTTAEPTTAEPTTAEPTTAEPTTAEPTTAEPTTAEPTTAEPTIPLPTEACFFANDAIEVVKGAVGFGQTAANMRVLEPKGEEDIWEEYVEFTAEPTGASFIFTVPIDMLQIPQNVGGVRVYAHVNGLNGALQVWSLQALNLFTSEFRTVLTNSNNEGWVWSLLSDTIAAPTADTYVSEANEMKFRLFTESNLDAFQIDFAHFCLVSRDDDLPPPPPTTAPTPFQPTPAPEPGTCFEVNEHFEPDTYSGGICGTQINAFLSDSQVRSVLDERLEQGCSIIQLDTRLSVYLSDEEFQIEADFIDFVSQEAHLRGIKVTIYYPTLEIITVNGENIPKTAYKEHPEWIQVGLNGKPNVFYGNQEDWVNPGEESAWMDPENDEFVQYYINRLLVLAQTEVDSLWLDVPLYYDTGVPWTGGSPSNAAAFKAWSNAQNLCPSTNGCPLPQAPVSYDPEEFKGEIFRAWLVWRHHSLANFLNRLRTAVKEARPSLDLFIENYPADYMDGTTVALDHSFFTSDMRKGMSTVWEIDSVSNKNAMQYASVEDFANQISMRKFANSIDKDSPTWNFVYTNEATDMGFALAGSLAVGNIPFETKTPNMKDSANIVRRTEWFNWLKRRTCEVLKPPREAEAAVLYSTGSRDFGDLSTPGCGYAMYNQHTRLPADDEDWWATVPSVTALNCPHVGGYRGAQYGLQQLHVPYKIVSDTGLEASDLVDIKLLWLPNVLALDSNSVSIINAWVNEGGTLLATGTVPGILNEYGQTIPSSVRELFGGVTDEPRYVVPYGKGTAIMRTDFDSRDLFSLGSGSVQKQNAALDTLEQIVRIHVPERLIITNADHIFVERSVEYNSKQYLYVVNYAGMQQPAVHFLQNVVFWYRPPPGKRVDTIDVDTPSVDPSAWKQDAIPFYREEGSEWVRTNAVVDQFSMFTVHLVDAPAPRTLPEQAPWANAQLRESSELALRFVLDKMRDSTREGSYKYGVFTNLIDTEEFNPLYAFGHHTTSENQGLLLRTTACMGDEQAFLESVQFVDDIMISPMYRLINWAMDRKKKHAFLTYDEFEQIWISANAPLDDFRAIMGLFEGADKFDVPRARELGESALNSVYWTSISDRTRASAKYPQYPGGIVGYAFDWAEVNSDELSPPGVSSGRGYLYDDNIPVDYNDLDLLYLATKVNPRYIATLKSSLAMILDAEIPQSPGLFYNNLNRDGTLRGDFEFLATEAPGKHLKTIQVLWTALHLAGAEAFVSLTELERSAAMAAARRSYNWFKDYYNQNDKIIPEYLTYDGEKVPLCPGGPDCLDQYANSAIGEARIYAQFARLGWLLGDDASFLEQVFLDKIRSDQVLDPQDPRFGMIGIEALGEGSEDSESFNILEAVMSMCRTQRNTPHQEF